jgi:hypothetical protein
MQFFRKINLPDVFMVCVFLLTFSGVFIGGFITGSDVKRCQKIVLQDIVDHQHFEAVLSEQVNPDFLTVMTRGR